MEGDACQETVRDPENNIELGGGEGNVVVSLFTSEHAWKGNVVRDVVHVVLVGQEDLDRVFLL